MGKIAQLFTVKLYNGEDEEEPMPVVLAIVEAPDAATWATNDMGSIEGARWESDGSDFAYASFFNTPGLVARLESEGYKLDVSEFTEAT